MPARYSGILATVCLAIFWPVLQVTRAEPLSDGQIIHVLNRLAFGPTLQDFHLVRSIGVDHYIAEQLNPQSIPEPFELQWRIAALDTLRYNAAQLRELYGPLSAIRGFKLPPELEKVRRERARTIVQQAAQARILRAVFGRPRLQGVLFAFWSTISTS